MAKLFQKIDDGTGKSLIFPIRISEDEKAEIIRQASIRSLTASEYVRRAVFHRRADVKIELEMILAVMSAVAELRTLHATFQTKGVAPPEEMRIVLESCEKAIIHLAKF